MKMCTKCKIEKELCYFSKNKNGKHGLDSKCKECFSLYGKKRYKEKREEILIKNKISSQKRRKEILIYNNEYTKQRCKIDPSYKLARKLRVRISVSIRRSQVGAKIGSKGGSAVKDLGCTLKEFKRHLESLWQPGMSWNNYGNNGWHIDHKIPLSLFDLTNREQFLKACHYTNLQPMWEFDNKSKGNKICQ